MKRNSDNYKKQGGGGSSQLSYTTLFRLKMLLNLITHCVLAALYAFEHHHQVTLQTAQISAENTPIANSIEAQAGAEVVVYTPVSNIIVVVFNVILATLVTQITCNISSQIEHIRAPTFVARGGQLLVKPSLRYRLLYWVFSIIVCLFIVLKDHGETVVEHGWFILASLCLLMYAPFWMNKAVFTYQDEVQEEEINAIDKQVLKALDRMSLSGRTMQQEEEHKSLPQADTDLELEHRNGPQMTFEDVSARGSIASSTNREPSSSISSSRYQYLNSSSISQRQSLLAFTSKNGDLESLAPQNMKKLIALQRPSFLNRLRQHVILPLCSPRFGRVVPAQSQETINNDFRNVGALNSPQAEQVQHSIMSRRNVESLTFLEEEGSNPSYERNENDAFVSSTFLDEHFQKEAAAGRGNFPPSQ